MMETIPTLNTHEGDSRSLARNLRSIGDGDGLSLLALPSTTWYHNNH